MNNEEIRNSFRNSNWLKDPFYWFSCISKIYDTDEGFSRELVVRALENKNFLSDIYKDILDELVVQVGLYPYIVNLHGLSFRNALIHASHNINGVMSDYTLHRAQYRILGRLLDGESIILSAPTSFGKSLLIDALIAIKNFENIVLILPTLALVEETRRRMSKFSQFYSIVTSSNQKITKNNIFVLTQERYLSMHDKIFKVDFFAIDEFYKLSIDGDGSRATQLNQAFFKLLKTESQFYLLGPSIKAISPNITQKLKCNFIIEDFHTVAVEVNYLTKKPNKIESLAAFLDKENEPTMVYCQSPKSTRELIREYLKIRELPISNDPEIIEAAKWTAEQYHDQWLVSVALRYGIGVHHGKLPRALGRFMIRAFEEGKLKILLCTSTLIEGVNTTAKNVIIFDNKLNRKLLAFFTYNNIKGRAGRMFKHFVGKVYLFDPPPEENLPFVDMPIVNPTLDTPSSILIQFDRSDVPPNLIQKYDGFNIQTELPFSLLKSNSGIEPEFLINTARHLNNLNIHYLMKLCWSSNPSYEQLLFSSEIIWSELGGKSFAKPMSSAKMMTKWISDLYHSRSVTKFRSVKIQEQINYYKNPKSPDDAVEDVLSFLRNWASFNYPKYLMTLNDIANHILIKKGYSSCNYSYFAATIENLFLPDSFSILEEYGLAFEVAEMLIKKRVFNKDDNIDEIFNRLKKNEISRFASGLFEKRMIEDFQVGIGQKIDKNIIT